MALGGASLATEPGHTGRVAATPPPLAPTVAPPAPPPPPAAPPAGAPYAAPVVTFLGPTCVKIAPGRWKATFRWKAVGGAYLDYGPGDPLFQPPVPVVGGTRIWENDMGVSGFWVGSPEDACRMQLHSRRTETLPVLLSAIRHRGPS